MLSGVNRGSSWAEDPGEGAGNLPESALGAYTSGLHVDWQIPVGFDADGAAVWLLSLMSGLMGAWWRIRSLVFLHQVQGFSLVVLVIFGPIVGGVILMTKLVGTGSFDLAVAIVLFLVRDRLSRGLSSGEREEGGLFLRSRLLMAFTKVLIFWVLYVMSVAYWNGVRSSCPAEFVE